MKVRLRQAATSVICAALIFGSLTGAAATPSELSWVAVAPLSGQTLSATSDGKLFRSKSTPFSLQEARPCQGQPDPGKKLDWFATKFMGSNRTFSIQCGSAKTHGYLHVAEGKSGHQRGWRKRVIMTNWAGSSDAWDELMWWSAIQSWNSPEISVNQAGGKSCRTALIEMWGPNISGVQNRKYIFRPTFIWSVTNDRLITAIPSTTSTC